MPLYITPVAIAYLTQLILTGLISAYLISLLWRTRTTGQQPAHAWLLTGFFVSFTVFLALFFLDASLLPTARLFVVFLLNAPLGLALVCLLQFAYHFPAFNPALRNEARLALLASSLYTLGEATFALYRYLRLGAGEFLYRPEWADIALLLFFLWLPWAFLRQLAHLLPPPTAPQTIRQGLQRWLTGSSAEFFQARSIQAIRTFIFIFLCVVGLNLFNVMHTYYILTDFLTNSGFAIGILSALFFFATTYFNTLPEMTSFMIKLAGVTLTILLAVMGLLGWTVLPIYEMQHEISLPADRTLRFTPNASGGYDAAEIAFTFENDLGENLRLDDGTRQPCSQSIAFPFPFFSQTYSQVFACNDGTVAMGRALPYRDYQYRYGFGTPLILALLSDLDPTISEGGVFARQEADRLLLTWDRLRGFRRPGDSYTFQVVLYSDGRFDLRYLDLPANSLFHPNDDPGAGIWAIGVVPGGLPEAEPQQVNFGVSASGWQSGPEGMVHDFVFEFRQHLNGLFAPLAWTILAASAAILIVLPPLLYGSLVKPLNALLASVRRIETGEYAVSVPVRAMDEIGFLTRAFNTLSADLGNHIHNLEERVAARTEALNAANKQLQTEMNEREKMQAALIEQQRALATYDERERMGRELHDGLGQVLGYINIQAQATETLLGRGQTAAAQANLQQVAQATRQAHSEVRQHILGLRENPRAAAVQPGFWVTLQAYLQQIQERYGLQAHLWLPENPPEPLFASGVEEQAMRILQEALTNIGKHAHAHRADVEFKLHSEQVLITVADDGIGFDASPLSPGAFPINGEGEIAMGGHYGLQIMRERAEQVGGELEICSRPGEGTRLTITLPRFLSASANGEAIDIQGLRVLLADDHPLFLDGLRNLLLARGVTVVGVAHDGNQAVEKARLLHPDVVVLDLNMPGRNGIEATRVIKAEMPEVKVVILTLSDDESHLFEAIQSGASGYLLKSLEANQFTSLLAGLLRGEAALSAGMAERMMAEFARRGAPPNVAAIQAQSDLLTPHQWEILRMVAQGMTYKEVGMHLDITEKTIKYHMGQIIEHLSVENRAQAIAFALQYERGQRK